MYFDEYAQSKSVDFVSLDKLGIKVTLSASLKSLKDKVKESIDKISDDIKLIETQEYSDEMLFEYKKSLNVSQAVTAVTDRHKAIEEQKAKTAEFIHKYFAKGRMIAIEGNIQTRNYDDKNGVKHYVTEVIVDNVSFTGEPKQQETQQTVTQAQNIGSDKDIDIDDFEVVISDGEVPF